MAKTYGFWSVRAVVAGLLLGALSACGGGDRAAAPAPQAAATAAAAVPVSVRVTSPRPHATVGSATTVTGRAPGGSSVLLRGGCAEVACQQVVFVDDDGRWKSGLQLAHPRATIEAGILGGRVDDRVPVSVRPPARPARPRPTPRSSAEPADESEAEPAPAAAPDRVVVVGDSLAVGIEGLLEPLLPGREVSFDAEIGRPLAAGMAVIGASALDSEPTVLAVSLFTNDDPTAVTALDTAVRQSVEAVGPAGCAVWATIVRPPYDGVSYRAANRRLAALSVELDHMRLVDWAARVAASPGLLGPDGVHPTPAGYRVRAELYAEAIRSCAAGG